MSKKRTAEQSPAENAVLTGTIHRQCIEDVAGSVASHFELDIQQMQAGPYRGTLDFIAVESQHVVHGKVEGLDWGFEFKSSVRAVPVVTVEPGLEVLLAVC